MRALNLFENGLKYIATVEYDPNFETAESVAKRRGAKWLDYDSLNEAQEAARIPEVDSYSGFGKLP